MKHYFWRKMNLLGLLFCLFTDRTLGFNQGKGDAVQVNKKDLENGRLVWTVEELSGSYRLMNPFQNLAMHTTGDGAVCMTENNGSDESQLWKLESVQGKYYLLVPANRNTLAVACKQNGGLMLMEKSKAMQEKKAWFSISESKKAGRLYLMRTGKWCWVMEMTVEIMWRFVWKKMIRKIEGNIGRLRCLI